MNSAASQRLSWGQKRELAQQAARAANNLRLRLGYDLVNPVCPFQVCEQLGIKVRFTDGGFEGAYLPGNPNRINIVAHRPLPRRRFTCAHEIGHHEFGHGASLDELRDDADQYDGSNPDEFLANSFAAHFLMPVLGIRRAFSRRGISSADATIDAFFIVAAEYGVGFDTLVTHSAFALADITQPRRKALLKERAAYQKSILQHRFGGNLVLIDRYYAAPTLDIEVGHWIGLPLEATSQSGILARSVSETTALFQAIQRGHAEIVIPDTNWNLTVRVTRKNFIGLAEYRFLDDDDDQTSEQ